MAIKAVRGVRDILPSEMGKWQRVEAAARWTFEAYGYREIRLPLFERTELFARGIGDETDIVKKEMYTFEDRGGDSITLRPEATAGLLRAYIEHGFQVEPKPVRLYTVGPMFRYERPQAGRYRQFHQANVEALGEPQPAVDAEVIAMLMDFFRELGLVERLGGPADPGVGFAIGLERVVLLLEDHDAASRPFVLLIPLGEAALRRLLPVTRAARQAGVAVELGYGGRKLPRELERANKLGVAYTVIAGDNEIASGEAVLRAMGSGEQRRVPLAALAAELVGLARKDGAP